MSSQVVVKDKKKRTGLRPVVGLILGLACFAVAYFAANPVLNFLKSRNTSFGAGFSPEEQQIGAAIVIFFVLITIVALIVAAFTPKQKLTVKDTDMVKERDQMRLLKEAERKRQQKLNREMRAEVRARNASGQLPPDNRR